jgi:superoxide dismutase, Fe-Mn family
VVPALTGRSLEIISRPNQDSPLLKDRRAVFGNDLWEHAYYLKHNNRRDDYLAGWWNVLNWDAINARYDAIRAGENIV